MNIQERVKAFHDSSLQYKRHMWEDHGIREFLPSCAAQYEDTHELVDIHLADAMQISQMTGVNKTAPQLAGAVLRGIFEQKMPVVPETFRPHKGKRLSYLVFSAEGYFGEVESGRSLEKDYATNPDTEVRKMIFTVLYERNAVNEVEVAVLGNPFHIEDGGGIVFEDETLEEAKIPRESDKAIHEAFELGVER